MTTRREVEALEKLARAKVRSAEAETKLYEAIGDRFLGKTKAADRTPPVLAKKSKGRNSK